METQTQPSTVSQTHPQPTQAKQAWHKPTITFMPLQSTAKGSGTTGDGTGSSTQE